MNLEIKALWINALKSGEFQQATGALCKAHLDSRGKVVKDGNCCLGVLSELAVRAGVIEPPEFDPTYEDDCSGMLQYEDDVALLPVKVTKWAGLESHNPMAGGLSLSSWNDGDQEAGTREPASFDKIAELIDKHL